MRSCVTLLSLGLAACSMAEMNRLYLVDQSDFGSKKGFYLSLENESPTGGTCHLADLTIDFGIADGKGWKFLSNRPNLKPGQTLKLSATYDGVTARLYVDGKLVSEAATGFTPLDIPLKASVIPDWARGKADYLLEQTSLVMSEPESLEVNLAGRLTGPLSLFESPGPWVHAYAVKPADHLRIDTTFRVQSDDDRFAPTRLVDRYGQAIAADWPEKVRSDEELKAVAAQEAKITQDWTPRRDVDRYGGQLGTWSSKPTGYYRVEKRGNTWWLISPLGHPLFYTGLCTAPALAWEKTPYTGREKLWTEVPPRDGLYGEVWARDVWGENQGTEYFGQQATNLIRKYGEGWKPKTVDSFVKRYQQWAFSGQGKWAESIPNVPYVGDLDLGGIQRVARHPDIYDPQIVDSIKKSLLRQMSAHVTDPYVVGWSIGNEYDETINLDEIKQIFKSKAGRPIDVALNEWLGHVQPSEQDFENARHAYAKAYYHVLYSTVKSIDPNHLYLGYWIVPGWWQNESDWDLIAPYCDVIGYDRYAASYQGIENLFAKADKPTLLGEFSFPAWYDGARGYGRYGNSVSTDADSGAAYARLLAAASTDPKCIGALWFQYRDEPITGRGPGKGPEPVIGEHFAFGMVTVADAPKWDLVRQVRAANLAATKTRLRL